MSRQFESVKQSGEINVKFEKAGDAVEGTFTGFLEDQGKDKNSCVYTLKSDDGEEHRFWGTKVLDDQMSKINIGTYTKVEFKGKVKSKAGREYNDFEVFQDTSTEGVAQAAAVQKESAPAAKEDDAFDDEEEDIF
jgi:hypothetical protein